MPADNVRLASRDWLWLLVVVAGASVANMGALHQISSNLQDDMLGLDRRWQDRTEALANGIKNDLEAIRSSIPPDWFRQMVDRNQERIDEIERRVDALEAKAR